MLQGAGFEVLTAMHANEALRHLADHGPRLTALFTDVETPGSMNDSELARHDDHHRPAIAVIVGLRPALLQARRTPGEGDLYRQAIQREP